MPGVSEGTSYSTPSSTGWRREGRFRDAHATPLYALARRALTGRHGFHLPSASGYLDPSERTLGTMFSDAGYATCVVGKWQLSYGVDDPRRPAAFGFDVVPVEHVEDRGPRYADRLDIDGELHDFPGAFGPDLCQSTACASRLRTASGPSSSTTR